MIRTIRNEIVKGLYGFTGCQVVATDNPNRKPDYPFISYKITTLNQDTRDNGAFSSYFVVSDDPNFRYDLQEDVEIQPYMVFSFNVYSDDLLEAQELAMECWEWFKLNGRQALKNVNCVPVDIGSVQDRTVHLVDFYEYKQGFDVSLRYLHKFDRKIENIESYKIEGGIE